jgi:regulator of sigma E protease
VIPVLVAAATAAGVLKIVLMILGAMVALSVVIVIHELGHFVVARRAGVEVEAFSIGFGPRIWGVRKGGVDYRLSLILFGGYVKMKGMESEGDKEPYEIEGGFFAARPGRRAIIAFAAPAMNILLALVVFTLLWFIGTKVPQGVLTTTIGYLEEGSPAREAGFLPGDTILEVNGQPVQEWKDIMGAVAFSPGDSIDLSVDRSGRILDERLSVQKDKEVGFRHLRMYPRMDLLVEDVEQNSLAQRLGLRRNDILLSLAGERLYHIDQFREILARNIGQQVDLVVSRPGNGSRSRKLSCVVPAPEEGIEVTSVKKDSLAKAAGLKGGDVIVTAKGQKVSTIRSLKDILNANSGRKVKLEVLRGDKRAGTADSVRVTKEDLLGASLRENVPVLGFLPGVVYGVRKENPAFATYSAVRNVLLTLKALITRTVSTKGISGPVGIVGMIAKSISISFTTFLYFIGFLSANFAVINLLPIPIVDGGHIMFCAIEKARGKPIRQKTMTVMLNIFFVLIVGFFLFVTWNDIGRIFKGGSEEPRGRQKKTLWLEVPESLAPPPTGQGNNRPSEE